MPSPIPFRDPSPAEVTLADALANLRHHDATESDRRIAAELERCALIEAARAAGATWTDLAATLGVTATAVRVRYNARAQALA
jgi:hypothetical protein